MAVCCGVKRVKDGCYHGVVHCGTASPRTVTSGLLECACAHLARRFALTMTVSKTRDVIYLSLLD